MQCEQCNEVYDLMGTIREQDIIITNLKADNERNKEVARELSIKLAKIEESGLRECEGCGDYCFTHVGNNGKNWCDECRTTGDNFY